MIAYVLMLLLGAAVLTAFLALASPLTGAERDPARAAFALVGAGALATPAAFLLANQINWRTPALRAANLQAMEGTGATFARANRGLVRMAAVLAPFSLALLPIAALRPWALVAQDSGLDRGGAWTAGRCIGASE